MPMMFFYFLKIIFDISTSKRSKKYKPHSILAKKKFEIRSKAGSTAEPNRLLDKTINKVFRQSSFCTLSFFFFKQG
jgi:hypothetical protein